MNMSSDFTCRTSAGAAHGAQTTSLAAKRGATCASCPSSTPASTSPTRAPRPCCCWSAPGSMCSQPCRPPCTAIATVADSAALQLCQQLRPRALVPWWRRSTCCSVGSAGLPCLHQRRRVQQRMGLAQHWLKHTYGRQDCSAIPSLAVRSGAYCSERSRAVADIGKG